MTATLTTPRSQARATDDAPLVVVNIFSYSYSGSTWVNLLFGSHPQAFSVGEIEPLYADQQAQCMVHGEGCDFWPRFDPGSGENLFVQLARLSGKRYLVVTNPGSSLADQKDERIASRFIHLVRDGRAVVASARRKMPGRSVYRAARSWRKGICRDLAALEEHANGKQVTVIYEKLKADTQGELRRVCEAIGLPFDPGMVEYWHRDHHFLWGNHGTLFAMRNKREGGVKPEVMPATTHAPNVQWDLDHYRKTDPGSFVDERWKRELNARQLAVFGLVAGRLNRRFGYPPTFHRGDPGPG